VAKHILSTTFGPARNSGSARTTIDEFAQLLSRDSLKGTVIYRIFLVLSKPFTFASNLVLTYERLGKPNYNDRPRFLRIKLKYEYARRALLSLHKLRLHNTTPPQIFIRPDLTKAQQIVDKEIRRRWVAAGKSEFVIRGKKLSLVCLFSRQLRVPTRLGSSTIDSHHSSTVY